MSGSGGERKRKTPWEKIVRAGKRGTGMRLTADEVARLAMDDAITTRAEEEEESRRDPE